MTTPTFPSNRVISSLFLVCSAVCLAGPAIALPVFPGAVGFGVDTPAGRGGKVFKVRNLNASGPDSLQECLAASRPRVCVFEVSGVIKLTDDLAINEPFITVAGQTAPSPGIMLQGAGIEIKGTHDVLIQHISVRVGDSWTGPDPKDRDGIKVVGSSERVVIDHVSMSWSTDETGSIWAYSPETRMRDITFSNCIIAEGLNRPSINPTHTSKGMIVGNALGSNQPANVAIVRNLFAHNLERNPFTTSAFIANNLIYNWQFQAIDIRGDYERMGRADASVIGNVFIDGPDTNTSRKPIHLRELTGDSKVYVADNVARWIDGSNQWGDLVASGGGTNLSAVRTDSAPVRPRGFETLDSGEVKQHVLANAGSRPADRDATDARVIRDVGNRTGALKSCVENCGSGDIPVPGGWPRPDRNFRVLAVPANPGGDDDGDGYTNLEEWLHGYLAEVEGGGDAPRPDDSDAPPPDDSDTPPPDDSDTPPPDGSRPKPPELK
ncbi:MAG: right-handed parallel beta-helix repeat-containing protein [Proteobacteria bacterium]|nr:right-handed parallel beta-helix repeat-containing protein [Pseudomonadota bacterium]